MPDTSQSSLPQQKQPVFAANPHLKTLLLILIVVFLVSGIGLAIMAQWQASYRQKIYDQTQSNLPKHQTLSTASSTQPVSSDNPTGTWKAYNNSKYSFSIKYPDTWVYRLNINSDRFYEVIFADTEGGQWKFDVAVAATTKSLDEEAAGKSADFKAKGYKFESQDVIISGQPAVRFFLTASDGVYGDSVILIVYKDKLYTISEGKSVDQTQSSMLNTFEFTK